MVLEFFCIDSLSRVMTFFNMRKMGDFNATICIGWLTFPGGKSAFTFSAFTKDIICQYTV